MKEQREVFDAVCTLSDFLGLEPQDIVSRLAFLNDELFQKLKTAINGYQEWRKLPLEERAKSLGYTVEVEDDKTVLSKEI